MCHCLCLQSVQVKVLHEMKYEAIWSMFLDSFGSLETTHAVGTGPSSYQHHISDRSHKSQLQLHGCRLCEEQRMIWRLFEDWCKCHQWGGQVGLRVLRIWEKCVRRSYYSSATKNRTLNVIRPHHKKKNLNNVQWVQCVGQQAALA